VTQNSSTNEKTHRRKGYKITLKRAKVAGIVGLAVVCVALFLMSPIFDVESIEVNINNPQKREEIVNNLGFTTGDNLFSIDARKARENIEQLDRVESCVIERSLSGTVTVTVNEKTELGYIKIKSGYAGVDETGKVMKICKTPELDAPVINGIKIAEPQKNDYIKTEGKKAKQKTEMVTRILSSLKEHDIVAEVKTIDVTNLKDISAMLKKDTLVTFGEDGTENKDRIEYKIAFLKAIISEPEYKGGGQIDISNTDMVRGTM